MREHEVEHGENEEVQVGKKPPVARIPVHVAHRIQVNDPAHPGYNQCHEERELVDPVGESQVQLPRRHPGEVVRDDRLAAEGDKQVHREDEGNRHDRRPDSAQQRLPGAKIVQKEREDAIQDRSGERKQQNEAKQVGRGHQRGKMSGVQDRGDDAGRAASA